MFDGDERVELEVQKETPTIVLHAKASKEECCRVLFLVGAGKLWVCLCARYAPNIVTHVHILMSLSTTRHHIHYITGAAHQKRQIYDGGGGSHRAGQHEP